MKYKILSKTNKKLRQIAEPVEVFDSSLRKLIIDMTVLMRKDRGIGLAAPQIGVSKRVAIVTIGKRVVPMINPTLNWESNETIIDSEGCLSVGRVVGKVKRTAHIEVGFFDGHGEVKSLKLSGLEARCVQHEIDHLDGILFIDKLEE
jgi:peptide deformylase